MQDAEEPEIYVFVWRQFWRKKMEETKLISLRPSVD